jgi:RimJ/RimL family protein N-acetyltransferase
VDGADGRASGGFTGDLRLRDVTAGDLGMLFEQQLDPEANYMAAFVSRDPTDRDAFMAHWARILGDEAIIKQTILVDGQVAGNVGSFVHAGRREVSYWIGKDYWGQGIATQALTAFLDYVTERPLYAGVAKDNIASLRVLQKCGFTICGEDKGFAGARGMEVEEYVLVLQAGEPRDGG